VPHSSVYCLLFMFIVLFILSQSSTSLSHPLFLISSLSLLSYQPSLISSLFLTLFNQLRNSQEGVVDRTLIANLLVSYFAKKRYRVMRLCRLWTTHCCSLPTRTSFIVVVKILFFLASFHTTRLPLLSHLRYLTHSIPVTSLLPLPCLLYFSHHCSRSHFFIFSIDCRCLCPHPLSQPLLLFSSSSLLPFVQITGCAFTHCKGPVLDRRAARSSWSQSTLQKHLHHYYFLLHSG
jgi:hypothetical protein